MIKKMVDINSTEFKDAVLNVLKREKLVINDIEDPRFERLPDGWIKDNELGIDWGPSSQDSMVFSKAEPYCVSLGGRLPTIDELQSIIDRDVHDPAINKQAFKDTKSNWYWSSTKTAWSNTARWCVGFIYGDVGGSSEDINIYVRPVRVSQC